MIVTIYIVFIVELSTVLRYWDSWKERSVNTSERTCGSNDQLISREQTKSSTPGRSILSRY